LINLCDNRRVLGVSCEDYRQNGAFAEFVAVPQHILYRLPEGLAFEHAALVEPFAIALHAVRRAPPTLNDTVVVVGAGMIGLALVQALSQAGCGRLIAVDIADEKLALAAKCGATTTVNSATEDAHVTILRLTRGLGADLAFEAVGVTATVDLTLRCLRKGSAATLVGNVTPKIEFPLQTAVTRELTIYGSCASQGEYPACLDMLGRGALRAAPLISATAPLADGAGWFERLYRKDAGLLKVVLLP
jgi:threonine dehydrogenase-like Zn-dependent dehydrogenase